MCLSETLHKTEERNERIKMFKGKKLKKKHLIQHISIYFNISLSFLLITHFIISIKNNSTCHENNTEIIQSQLVGVNTN